VSLLGSEDVDSHKADTESKRPKEDLAGAHSEGNQNFFDSHPDELSFLSGCPIGDGLFAETQSCSCMVCKDFVAVSKGRAMYNQSPSQMYQT